MVSQAAAGNAYDLTRTMQQLTFLHASAGYPTQTTFLRAIRPKYFLGWPHLTLRRAAPPTKICSHGKLTHAYATKTHLFLPTAT